MAKQKSGRPRKPSALKLVQGTAQKCRMNEAEPQPAEDKVKPPADLCAVAKKEFLRILDLTEGTHIVTNADVPALAEMCKVYATYREAEKKCKSKAKGGGMYTVNGAGSLIHTPWYKTMVENQKTYISMLSEFGLTPSSRSRVIAKAPGGKGKSTDPWDEL